MWPARGRRRRHEPSTTPAHIAKGAPAWAPARPAPPVGSLRSWPRWSSRAALLLVSPHVCERDRPDACQCRRRSALVLRRRLRPAPDTDCFRFPRRLVPSAVLPSSPSVRALLEHDCATARSAASQFFVSRPPPGAVLRHQPLDAVLPAPSAGFAGLGFLGWRGSRRTVAHAAGGAQRPEPKKARALGGCAGRSWRASRDSHATM